MLQNWLQKAVGIRQKAGRTLWIPHAVQHLTLLLRYKHFTCVNKDLMRQLKRKKFF